VKVASGKKEEREREGHCKRCLLTQNRFVNGAGRRSSAGANVGRGSGGGDAQCGRDIFQDAGGSQSTYAMEDRAQEVE